MISEKQMKDIRKRMEERKKEFKASMSKVIHQSWNAFGHKPIDPNKEVQAIKKKERKIMSSINLKRPCNAPRKRPRDEKKCMSLYKTNRPMKVMEV